MAEHPLTSQDLDQLNTNLENLNVADAQIRQAEQAGIDVTVLKEQARANRNQLLKIKQSYFPGK